MKKGTAAKILILALGSALAGQERSFVLYPGETPARSQGNWEFRDAALSTLSNGKTRVSAAGAAYAPDESTDLLLHFDRLPFTPDAGGYALAPSVQAVRPVLRAGRLGPGAAQFFGKNDWLRLEPGPGSLLAKGSAPGSFTIEFWISPARTEDGETIFQWKASRYLGARFENQEISAEFSAGRLRFILTNVFTSEAPAGISLVLEGRTVIVPSAWSHHLLRFDFETGLVEYAMNGVPEAIAHASLSGHEDVAVCRPMIGGKGSLVIGERYAGLVDEFRISRSFVEHPVLAAYPSGGARIVSPVMDLSDQGSRLLKIEAAAKVAGSQGAEFFYRCGQTYADWTDAYPAWIPFSPTRPIASAAGGRFAQVAVNLYPDGPGETSPSLDSLAVIYLSDPPPPPPARLTLVPADGEILVSWTRVPERDLGGYLVYYGESARLYGGVDSLAGKSPIDAGDATSLRLTGLKNGKLYYVAVAAYDSSPGPDGSPSSRHEGEFSAEATARPLRTVP